MSCGAGAGAARAAQLDLADQAVIQGTVVRGDKAVEGAYVRLLDSTGEFVAEVPSGRFGDFRFFAAPGSWTVRVLAPRAEPVESAVTAARGTVSEVELTLDASSPPPSEDRESQVGRRDERPWGDYEVVADGSSYLVKRITVRPGQRLSYQRHRKRSEHWVVVAGSGFATTDGTDHRLSPGAVVDVPVGAAHRVTNDGGTDLTFIEVQTGSYFGEDDIERLEDDYGRGAS